MNSDNSTTICVRCPGRDDFDLTISMPLRGNKMKLVRQCTKSLLGPGTKKVQFTTASGDEVRNNKQLEAVLASMGTEPLVLFVASADVTASAIRNTVAEAADPTIDEEEMRPAEPLGDEATILEENQRKLRQLGFVNERQNARLLCRFDNDVESALTVLQERKLAREEKRKFMKAKRARIPSHPRRGVAKRNCVHRHNGRGPRRTKDDKVLFQENMAALAELGFHRPGLNRKALRHTENDLDSAVEMLKTFPAYANGAGPSTPHTDKGADFTEDEKKVFRANMAALEAMGYHRKGLNKKALRSTGNDLDKAVDMLAALPAYAKGATGAKVASRANKDEDKALFWANVAALEAMGFHRKGLNKKALRTSGNDLADAVEQLEAFPAYARGPKGSRFGAPPRGPGMNRGRGRGCHSHTHNQDWKTNSASVVC